MSLKKQLEQLSKDTVSQVPEEVLEIMKKAAEELLSSGIAEKSLGVGDQAPEFTLPGIKGQQISSKALLGKGPLIVSFVRGSWCPYCNLEVRAWQMAYSQVKDAGAELITISPNTPGKFAQMESEHGVEFELLSDIGNKVAREYGLVFTLPEELRPIYEQFGINIPEDNGDESYELPMPATYVINTDGKIVYSFVDADYTKRAEPSEVLAAVKKLK